MAGGVIAFIKGVARVWTPVDDIANPLPVDISGGGAPPIVEADGMATAAAPVYIEGSLDPLSMNLAGDLRVIAKQSGAWAITETPTPSTIGTQTSVASSAASVAILAANAARLGATVVNDGSNNLYMRLNAGAATTATFTVKIAAGGYYELPFRYTGAITGIWDVATGSARITELT